MSSADDRPGRARRPPPPFLPARVREVELLSPRMARVRVAGPALAGFTVEQPAASVRLLLGEPGADLPAVTWTGNEFRLAGGGRPTIRTLTPRRADPAAGSLDVEVVLHGQGAASRWARSARPGTPVGVSGPGRGYVADADDYLLAGDETALAAIAQLLEWLPAHARVTVAVEIVSDDARRRLPAHPGATVAWHELAPGAPPGDGLVAAVRAARLEPTTRVWAAGEAAACQRIRRHLFDERGLDRAHAAVRGYWKHGRVAVG